MIAIYITNGADLTLLVGADSQLFPSYRCQDRLSGRSFDIVPDPNQIDPGRSACCPNLVLYLASISSLVVPRVITQLKDGRLHVVAAVSYFGRQVFQGLTSLKTFDLLRLEIAPLATR